MYEATTEVKARPSVHPKETTQYKHIELTYRETLLVHHGFEYLATREAYRTIDFADDTYRVSDLDYCRTEAWYAIHLQSGRVRVLSSSCRLRWCPMCAQARARLIASNLTPWLKKRPRPKFLTLTLKHSDDDLQSQIVRLYKCFTKFRNRVFVKKAVVAGVWFFQVKFSEKSQQWHPHLHCVLDAEYMPHSELRSLWLSCTGDSTIVDIRAVRDPKKVAEYVARYAARPCLLSELTENQRVEVIEAMHGRRLCGKWGDALDLELSTPKSDIENDYVMVCPFSQLKALAKINEFGSKLVKAALEKEALPEHLSRDNLKDLVHQLLQAARPEPPPPPVEMQITFTDGTASWRSLN